MADFCNKCSEEMFGDLFPADIDVPKIFESLKVDTYIPVLCEGCGMLGIGKNKEEELIMIFAVDEDDKNQPWIIKNINEYKI